MTWLEYSVKTVPSGWRKILYLNWPLVVLLSAVAGIGFLMLYSVAGGSWGPWAEPQMKRYALGLAVMFAVAMVPIWFWRTMSLVFYMTGLGLLVMVEFFGSVGMGAQRWIDLGFMRLQPSELMKIALVMFLAAYYDWLPNNKVSRPLWVILPVIIILATVFFALGVILPVIKFTTVFVWTAEHSIATIIYALYQNGEHFLCAVLFIFSILFPFLKLFYLLTLVTSPDLSPEFRAKSISTMEWLGRYSMTDVMVLALMIFYVNSSGYTEAVVQPGVYFFAASAIMTMLAYGWANTTAPKRVRVLAQEAAHSGGIGEHAR